MVQPLNLRARTLNFLPTAALAAALLASGAGLGQETGTPQLERVAAGLKRGMSSEEVRRLLGPPTRTSLRTEGNSSNDERRGSLQWTYTWVVAAGPGTLNIEFGARVPETWTVTRWQWAGP